VTPLIVEIVLVGTDRVVVVDVVKQALL
jgi:hypothetical protein